MITKEQFKANLKETIDTIVFVIVAVILYIKTNMGKQNQKISGTMVEEMENEYIKQRI